MELEVVRVELAQEKKENTSLKRDYEISKREEREAEARLKRAECEMAELLKLVDSLNGEIDKNKKAYESRTHKIIEILSKPL